MHGKPHLNIAVVGHLSCGKSTLVGHLSLKLGSIDRAAVEKNEKEASAINKRSYKYAWALNKSKSERERGITIDKHLCKVETPKYLVTVSDVPGHKDYVKNMITGTFCADALLLVVDASHGAFEWGISKDGQTREHAQLAYSLGVRQLIVVVNKMDTAKFDQGRYDEIRTQVTAFLKKLGFNTEKVPFVPVSAWTGDSLRDPSKRMTWYDGPSLVAALDEVDMPRRLVGKPLRIPIMDVFHVKGTGVIPCGRIEAGTLRPGMSVTIVPGHATLDVSSVHFFHQQVEEAYAGDAVGIRLQTTPHLTMRRGHVICDANSADLALEATSFTAKVFVQHPGKIVVGYTPMLNVHTAHVPCRFSALLSKLDRKTGQEVEARPAQLVAGDVALVELVPLRPLVVEAFADYPPLGRFCMRDLRQVVGLGVIISVTKKRPITRALAASPVTKVRPQPA
mmetsp:Transcript_7491/g.16249  ORF Transcript_7491/g.16249 Transcript_7491/m.16249 type:complete len:450 (+) Transcript_7491:238-1587(+)|eukprot:CAMPEP_0202923072 /NCGR_PEP_ID=MMETSP1392-20130828/78254_1 /ASSEMBLY_ACC=CAM_ASM_000868 /TAXON_ID=225041 /ORGANISM="Chlamydomonas chlamydogama, Strain SAG 11-48b" /LENGTH=449 /DNA_ID=CAMNT_0049616733 /DNA_START=211 /DNA_END=1560 /DNA_ORIENTATION=+